MDRWNLRYFYTQKYYFMSCKNIILIELNFFHTDTCLYFPAGVDIIAIFAQFGRVRRVLISLQPPSKQILASTVFSSANVPCKS